MHTPNLPSSNMAVPESSTDPREMCNFRHPDELKLLLLAKRWSPFEDTCALCFRRTVPIGGLCPDHLENVLPHVHDPKKMKEFRQTARMSEKQKYESLELTAQQMEQAKLPSDCCLVCGDQGGQMVCTQHVHGLLLMSRKKIGEMCATKASAIEKIALNKRRRIEMMNSRRTKPRTELTENQVLVFNAMLTPHK